MERVCKEGCCSLRTPPQYCLSECNIRLECLPLTPSTVCCSHLSRLSRLSRLPSSPSSPKNIVLSGGSTMFKDFGRRLMRDIKRKVDGRLAANQKKVRYTHRCGGFASACVFCIASRRLVTWHVGIFECRPSTQNIFTSTTHLTFSSSFSSSFSPSFSPFLHPRM